MAASRNRSSSNRSTPKTTTSSDSAESALLELLRFEKARRNELARYDWSRQGRPEQQLPGGRWRYALYLAGRGWGKTRTGSEAIRTLVGRGYRRVALVGSTSADARDVIVEGESGVLSVWPRNERPKYEPSKRKITFHNGAVAHLYSAEEPDRLRGPQHDAVWADELAAWRNGEEAWSMLMMGLRLGDSPRAIITTTPRPSRLIRALVDDPLTHLVRGRTMDNRANLAPGFIDELMAKYEGTRIGRQELDAEILADVDGAAWSWSMIEAARTNLAPDLTRVVVAVDPATTASAGSDFTGIVVAGKDAEGMLYVLHAEAMRTGPEEWTRRVWSLFEQYRADRIVFEGNQSGEIGVAVLRQGRNHDLAPITRVHARRGKFLRAEPVVMFYEQDKVRHVGSAEAFRELEEQMTSFPVVKETHDDLVDALVYAVSELAARGAGVSVGGGWR